MTELQGPTVTVDVHRPHGTRRVTLGHGALVGRLDSAALRIDDSAVSEAHALVSLRKGGLRLLALRRRFTVEGKTLGEVALRAGLRIELAPHTALSVVDLGLPEAMLGLVWADGEVPLLHDAASVVLHPEPHVAWRLVPQAAARLWRVGAGWRLQQGDQAAVELREGDRFTVGGVGFEARSVRLARSGASATVSPLDPLELLVFYDTVHVCAAGRPVLVITGKQAQLITELALAGVPMEWATVARELWPRSDDDHQLRKRLDAVLSRLRRKLVQHAYRSDLVSPSGRGLLELRLGPRDRVSDRT